MLVRYRANGRVADLSEASAAQLIAARICEGIYGEGSSRNSLAGTEIPDGQPSESQRSERIQPVMDAPLPSRRKRQ